MEISPINFSLADGTSRAAPDSPRPMSRGMAWTPSGKRSFPRTPTPTPPPPLVRQKTTVHDLMEFRDKEMGPFSPTKRSMACDIKTTTTPKAIIETPRDKRERRRLRHKESHSSATGVSPPRTVDTMIALAREERERSRGASVSQPGETTSIDPPLSPTLSPTASHSKCSPFCVLL